MFAIVLALAASVSWGSADFLGGLSTKRLSILTVAAVSQFAGFVFTLTVVLVVKPGLPSSNVVLIGLVAGVVGTIGLAALYSGLALGPMGVVAPIAAMSGIVPVVVGLVRGERPGSIQLVGVALAIGGVILAARHRNETGARINPRAVVLALIAAGMLGLLVVLLDAGGSEDPAWTVLLVRVGSLILLAMALTARRPSFAMDRGQLGTLAAVGVMDNGANLLFVLAAQRGLLSLIAVLASLYPVATVLLARGVLRERLGRTQVVGVAMALGGVALIALG
jgi:drug/metabolite transporter (DMT)-like permease